MIITGENEEDVKAAEQRIRELIVVKDDRENAYKQAQMRELAIINGQLARSVFCAYCGEEGHSQYDCPERESGETGKG